MLHTSNHLQPVKYDDENYEDDDNVNDNGDGNSDCDDDDNDNDDDDDNDDGNEKPHCQRLFDQLGPESCFPLLVLSPLNKISCL